MHLHGHRAVVLAATGSRRPAAPGGWTRSTSSRRDVRHRLRGGQSGHLDGPLPQPEARRRRHGRPPDVRGRGHPVSGRRSRGKPTRIEARHCACAAIRVSVAENVPKIPAASAVVINGAGQSRRGPNLPQGAQMFPLRRVAAAGTAAVVAFALVASVPAQAKAARPSKITSVSAAPGSIPGQVIFRWKSAGANTDYFLLETGLTSFSPSKSSSLPTHGRGAAYFRIERTARTFVMSPTDARAAGAPVESGRHLYFRLFAVNKERSSTSIRAYPYLRAVLPKGAPTRRSPRARRCASPPSTSAPHGPAATSGTGWCGSPTWRRRSSRGARRGGDPGAVAGPGRRQERLDVEGGSADHQPDRCAGQDRRRRSTSWCARPST